MKEVYLYFRTQATLADDDDSAQSCCIPLSSFKGMHPTSDTALTIFYTPQIRNVSDGQDGNVANNDSIVLTVGTNGTLSIVTTDDAAAAANMTLTADGTFEADGTTVTLDSDGDVVLVD